MNPDLAVTNAVDSQRRPAHPEPIAMVAEILLADHPEGTDWLVAHLDEQCGAHPNGSTWPTGLVDRLRLVVAPTIIGAGRRLLTHPSDSIGVRLLQHEVTAAGLLALTPSSRPDHHRPSGQRPQDGT